MKLACLGPKGTFSEEAAMCYDSKAQIVDYPTIEEAIYAVATSEADEAIVPLENSIEGAVNITLDKLIFGENVDLFIKAQLDLPISQNLLVKTDYNGEAIEKILSHPQPIAQTRMFIGQQYPSAALVPTLSTAEASRIVSQSCEPVAAIAPKRAAEIYGLRILHHDIQDNNKNMTSFVVITKQNTSQPKPGSKLSLAFSTQNKPGELYKILDIFAIWDLNMTKIISRPMKDKPGAYVFFIDLEGYINMEDVSDALTMIQRKTSFYKNLGAYRIFTNRHTS